MRAGSAVLRVRIVTTNRVALYLFANLLFVGSVATAFAINGASGVHPVYLILLFALCSTPIIDMTVLNGQYALLMIFSLNFFLFYGSLDVDRLMSAQAFASGSDTFMSSTEWVILLGGALAHLGYRIACRAMLNPGRREPKDWPELMLVVGGAMLWAVCTILNWQ